MHPVGAVRWSGAGCLVGPLLLLGLTVGVVSQGVFNGNRVLAEIGWVAGFVLSAVLIRTIGNRLNRKGDVHTLYDSPMQNYMWLAIACAGLTLGMLLLFRFVGV